MSEDDMAPMPGSADDQGALEVDARGLRCPLPVIRLAAALAGVAPGGLVRLLATDPAAETDVPAFCRLRGTDLVDVAERSDAEGGHTAYLVRQVSPSPAAGGPAAPG
jgi:tRNA 2-thiouridine synthesizing protein A